MKKGLDFLIQCEWPGTVACCRGPQAFASSSVSFHAQKLEA